MYFDTYSCYFLSEQAHKTLAKEEIMDKKELKKILAGFGIAGLVAGAALTGGPRPVFGASG